MPKLERVKMAIPTKMAADDLDEWIKLSFELTVPSHGRGMIEVQSVGNVHIALQKFEQRHKFERLSQEEAMQLAMDGVLYYEVGRLWVLGVFSLAYKIERGDVLKKRSMKSFKKYINPLRNAFEKGYVDGDASRGVYPEMFFNVDPYHCMGWALPNREGAVLEFYRAEIAHRLFEACQEA